MHWIINLLLLSFPIFFVWNLFRRKSNVSSSIMRKTVESTHIACDFSSFDSLLYNRMIFTIHCLVSSIIIDGFFLLFFVINLKRFQQIMKRFCQQLQIVSRNLKQIKGHQRLKTSGLGFVLEFSQTVKCTCAKQLLSMMKTQRE